MKYKNTKNGVIIETTSKMSGNWELVEEKKQTPKRATTKKKAEE